MNVKNCGLCDRSSWVRISLFILTICILIGVVSQTLSAQETQVLRAAQSQMISEMSVWTDSAGVTLPPPEAVLERVHEYPGLVVWRVIPSLFHAHPLTIAVVRDQVVRLGGFPSPDLYRISRALSGHLDTQATAEAVADKLARLADRFGAVRCFLPNGQSVDSLLQPVQVDWSRRVPPDWPHDAVRHTDSGSWRVTTTILCQNTRSFNGEWLASVYTFELDPDGSLVSWARREAEPFAPSSGRGTPPR